MVMPNLPIPKFPDVPNVPGVPPVLRNALAPVQNELSILTGGLIPAAEIAPPQWGIFTAEGDPWILGDSCVALDLGQDWALADFPVEGGSFETYNKVVRPGMIKVSLVKSGKPGDRADFLRLAKEFCESRELATVVTPEIVYENMNGVHYDYRRDGKSGFQLIQVDIWVQEARIRTATTFTKTQAASGADPVSGGTVQAQKVPDVTAQERSLKVSGEAR